MKNYNNPIQSPSGSTFAISVTIDEVPLLRSLVEKLAHRRYPLGYSRKVMPPGLRAIETSSIEAYVSGSMDIINNDEEIALSYTTCFSFTCIRPAGGENSLSWINSLS